MEHGSHQTRKETLEMRKRKPLALAGIGVTAIITFLLTPVFLLTLAGCGSVSKTATPAHAIVATGTTCSDASNDGVRECIVYSGYKQGGLSCDWRHVSGADKEPAR